MQSQSLAVLWFWIVQGTLARFDGDRIAFWGKFVPFSIAFCSWWWQKSRDGELTADVLVALIY
jgi:hypothetical protein